MELNRQFLIENYARTGNLSELISILSNNYTQLELDIALENAIAYSRIETANYLISLGANFSNYDYQGVYYAVHNNELEGLKFAIQNGVNINIDNGMIINTSIFTSINNKSTELLEWILANGANPNLINEQNLSLVSRSDYIKLKEIMNNVLQK